MRRIAIIITSVSLLLLLGQCTQSVRQSSLPEPEQAVHEVTPVDVAAYIAKYPNYDGVMLEVERTIEHSGVKQDMKSGLGLFGAFVKNWEYSQVYREKFIILNPEAQWLTTYELYGKPDKLYMITVSPAGQVSRFGKADLREIEDERGERRYKIAFPRIEKGTVVEIGWEESYNVQYFFPPLEYTIALQYRIPCERLKFSFAYPSWWEITAKANGQNKSVPVTYKQDDAAHKTTMLYEASDIPAVRPEPYCPPFRHVASYLQFRVTHLEMMGNTWDASASWDKILEEFRKYIIKKAYKQSKIVQKTVDSLTAGAATSREKIDRIGSWVAASVRPSWVGNDGDPEKTLKAKAGSIYDITTLTQAMLLQAKIPSEFMLVHDADDGWFDASYVSGKQLWAPALNIHTDSGACLLFPWIKRLPPSVVPDNHLGEIAIFVNEDAKKPFLNVPDDNIPNDSTVVRTDVTVDSTGLIHAAQTQTLTGIAAYELRLRLDKTGAAERRKIADSLLSIRNADFTIDTFSIQNDTMYGSPLMMNYGITIRNLVAHASEEIVVQTAELLGPIAAHEKLDSLDRMNPVWVRHGAQIVNRVEIHYPSAWALSTALQGGKIENQFGTANLEFVQENGRLVVNRTIALKKAKAPKEAVVELANLLESGANLIPPALVFKVTGAKGTP